MVYASRSQQVLILKAELLAAATVMKAEGALLGLPVQPKPLMPSVSEAALRADEVVLALVDIYQEDAGVTFETLVQVAKSFIPKLTLIGRSGPNGVMVRMAEPVDVKHCVNQTVYGETIDEA